jgi:hypothetical protein
MPQIALILEGVMDFATAGGMGAVPSEFVGRRECRRDTDDTEVVPPRPRLHALRKCMARSKVKNSDLGNQFRTSHQGVRNFGCVSRKLKS